MDQGFIDLRQNGHGQGMGESFWPSFTDIMTVVVMIFIITSTVLIIRNWELLAELQQTIEAERLARNLARQQQESNQTLEEQVAQLESRLTEAQIRNLGLAVENNAHKEHLSKQEQALVSLRSDKEQLLDDLRSAKRRETVLSEDLSQARILMENEQLRREQMQDEYGRQGERLESALAQLEQQEATLTRRRVELKQALQEGDVLRQHLTEVKEKHKTLEAKYQMLIRPARTAEGKHVVDVRIGRYGGKERIQLRTPAMPGYREVTQVEMHQRLSRLKQRYKRELYVKIIIPSDSGLTYNEAWEFTRKLLTRYDYYYDISR